MAVDSHEAALPPPELAQLLLDAKFAVPRPRPGVVSRVGLVKTARSSDRRLVGVTAPAGYGKSIFLAQWAAAEERPVAWVSLDRFDDDPAKLLVSLASAYCRAGLCSPDLVAAMGGPGVSVLGRAAPRLAAEFRASAVPFILMLDDLHALQSPACHDVLGLLIAAIPHGSQLAAASRSEQPHLSRLRAAGGALEFGVADLALDAAGAQQIFALKQVSLTPEQAAAVAERAEGWPVGLYLAAVIAKQSRGQAPAITGDDPYVADYLYREALTQQPEDRQRFVRRTAVLDQLSGPLCDAVLGFSGAAGQLRRMEATSLFVISLGRRREWYRYHDLFREFLLGELRRTEPDLIAALHRRAADWYEANGFPALALEHLLRATDWEQSTRLASKLYHSTFEAGQVATVQRWLRAIGDANIERCPPLAVLRCWVAVLTGDTAGALRWAAFVETASFDGVPADGTASFESARAMLRAGMCPAGPEAMMADAAFAVAQEPEWSEWRSTALSLFAAAHLLRGNLDRASSLYAEASAAAAKSGHHEGVVTAESQLAWLAMDRGDWREAADRLERALATIDKSRMHDYLTSLPAFAGAARLSLYRGDLNETRRQLARAMRARPSATYVLPIDAVRARLELAKVYLALADLATARQLLREIDDIQKHRPALGTLVDDVGDLRRVLASTSTAGVIGRLPLTPAELRLLPYLQTHLTADGIAERLFVSIHTVKSEMSSIYRKLGVSSRSKAAQKATAIGLLGE